MRSQKRYIPFLISIALFALIGLQVLWLMNVYTHELRELGNKTQEALLETSKRLQNENDSKLILSNIDSLLVSDTLLESKTKNGVKMIVSTIKNKITSVTPNAVAVVEKNVRVVNDSTSTTTIVRIDNTNANRLMIKKEISEPVKKKADELKDLFLKMAVEAKSINSEEKIDFTHVENVLKEELEKRGIDLKPEISISPSKFNLRSKKPLAISNSTINWHKAKKIASSPLFPDSIIDQGIVMSVGYITTVSFLVKQMGWMVLLSILITLLVFFVMIHIFKRMLSQEKLHELKNDFINNMTHELKTPIATISLAIDSINNPQVRKNDDKLNEYTSVIKEENKKLNLHVEKVLQMALLEKGEMAFEKKPGDLVAMIQHVIKANQLRTEACKGSIEFRSDLKHAMVIGDEFSIQNVLNNLIDNSLKYSKEPCNIVIDVVRDHAYYIISVKDNGIGMDTKELNAIFDKFYRVERGNLHEVKGTGLGLSYVRSIVELHDGTINVKSELGKGSTFSIRLKAND